MTTVQGRLAFGTRRSWLAHLLDSLLEPSNGKGARLDPRLLPPHLQRDMGLLDPADDGCARPEPPPSRWQR